MTDPTVTISNRVLANIRNIYMSKYKSIKTKLMIWKIESDKENCTIDCIAGIKGNGHSVITFPDGSGFNIHTMQNGYYCSVFEFDTKGSTEQ